MRMDRTGWLCGAMLCALAAWPAHAGAEVRMGKAVAYPHVGLSLAVPEGFEPIICVEPYDAMRAVLLDSAKAAQGVTVSVFPVDKKKTHAQFAEDMIADMKANLAVRQVKVLKTAQVRIAGQDGTGCRLQYLFRGVRTTAARVFFTRDVPATGGRLCYVLTIESNPKHEESLLPVLDAVMKSFKLSAIRRPAELTVTVLGPPFKARHFAFSIRPPRGWYVVDLPAGLEITQTDYSAGGMPTTALQITARKTPEGATSRALALGHLARATKAFPRAKTLWQGEVTLAGLKAYQFVLHQEPKVAASSSAGEGKSTPAAKPTTMTLVQTAFCVPEKGKSPARTYDLVLLCHGGKADNVRATMARIAESFTLLDRPAPKPTTKPATGAKPAGPDKPGKPTSK